MIFGREPAVWLAALRAVLGAIIALGWWKLTNDQVGAILAIAAAVSGVILAFQVHPFPPAAVAHLGEAVLALVLAFKLHVQPEAIAGLVIVAQMIVALATRQSVIPVAVVDSIVSRRRTAPARVRS